MNTVHDPERRITAFFEEGIEVLPDWVLDAVRDEIDTTQQRRAWRPAWRIPTMSYPLRVGLVLALVFLGLGLALATRINIGSTPPTPPSPATWTGPVRADAGGMPVLSQSRDAETGWADGRDAAVPWVDIRAIHGGFQAASNWHIQLAGWPPRAEGLDPDQTVIAYGVVLDTNRDRVPDYEFGINNDAPEAGDFRVWVTDLAAGHTNEKVGPPYGFPVEFGHPDEQDPDDTMNGQPFPPTVNFLFLGSSRPSGPPEEVLPSDQWQFYVWATVTEGGEVVAWDYAPDSGWLTMASP
jgi:hypothetical protein